MSCIDMELLYLAINIHLSNAHTYGRGFNKCYNPYNLPICPSICRSSETFTRWLHYQHAPVELLSTGVYRFVVRYLVYFPSDVVVTESSHLIAFSLQASCRIIRPAVLELIQVAQVVMHCKKYASIVGIMKPAVATQYPPI